MSPEKKAERFPCPGCGGDMQFDPSSGGMKCPFCGHAQALAAAAPGKVGAHPLEEFLQQGHTELTPLSGQALEVSCGGCGAVVTFEPPEVAGSCPFCGASLVAQPKAADPTIAPDAVLPAKIPKEQAQAEVRQWLQSRWFAPGGLKKMARDEGIAGVYLPFWDYDADTFTRYTGERGTHYWVTETYTETDSQGNSVQRTRQVMQTSWAPVSGEVSRHFDGVLVAASRAVHESKLNALEPWDLESMCPYEPSYLAGFKAQRYQTELPEGFEKAKAAMRGTIEEDARQDIGGDEQRVESLDSEYSHVTFRHLLLPVWIGAYQFQSKVYQVAVNARTGEVQGDRPYSAAKITLLVVTILLLIGILIILGSHH